MEKRIIRIQLAWGDEMKKPESNPFISYSLITLFGVVLVGAFFSLLIQQFGVAAITPWIIFTIICGFLFLIGRWLVKGIQIAKDSDPTTPSTVGSFPTNYEAQILVSKLIDAGINANAVGGFTSGFQAESPGYVDVVVPRQELEAAQKVLRSIGPIQLQEPEVSPEG